MPVFYCSVCPFFATKMLTVVTHVGIAHAHDPNFRVQCGIEQCQCRFTNYGSYRKHLRRKHQRFMSENEESAEPADASTDMDIDMSASVSTPTTSHADEAALQHAPYEALSERLAEGEQQNTDKGSSHSRACDFLNAMGRSLLQFYLKVTETYKLPRSTAEAVFSDVRAFVELLLQGYRELLKSDLSHCGMSTSGLTDQWSCDIGDLVDLLWANVSTEHTRLKHIKQHFPYVAPVAVTLSESGSAAPVPDLAYYVPIRGVLSNMLKSDEVAGQVLRQHDDVQSAHGSRVLRDITDGDFVREQHLISDGTLNTLLVLLYTDELEIVNPLGAAAGQHKILCVYFVLLNLHPRYRSRLSSVQLVLLVKFSHVKRYGIGKVLQPLLDDLTALKTEGVKFVFEDREIRINVTVCAVVGDNLSLNRLGGFSCSFHAGRVCRHCLGLSQNLSTLLCESDCLLRTAKVHQSHLSALVLDKANARVYGVTEKSCLLALPGFDVTSQLPPDAMHDILEGNIGAVIKNVLQGLRVSGCIGNSDLERTSTFQYHHLDKKTKPPPLGPSFLGHKGSLKGTAAQKLCLFHLLPQMLADLVPEGDSNWEVYLVFRDIVDIILSDRIPESSIEYLETQITAFLRLFVTVYPQATVTPKLHFLVHYPRYIRLFGPPRNFWCMRFEAKHSYFKNTAVRVRKFATVCKTLAERHQLLQCYEFSSLTGNLPTKTSLLKPVSVASMPYDVTSVLGLQPLQDEVIHEAKEITVDCTTYRAGDVFLIGWSDESPVFVQIRRILLWRGVFHIACQMMNSVRFNRHRQCHEVTVLHNNFVRLMPGKELCHHPMSMYAHDNVQEVIAPYKLFETTV